MFQHLSDHGKLKLESLVGGGSDGASVITGIHSGIMTRIKSQVPMFHCYTLFCPSCISIACVDDLESFSLVKQFHLLVNQIYSFFARSTVITADLEKGDGPNPYNPFRFVECC